MRYCRRCITPDTRPSITLDGDGVCNACRAFESRANIDWGRRAAAFAEVAHAARARAGGYDCVVPVSGGKDSTWQVVTCLEHGLRPLAVTWCPPARTDLGRRNLRNLVELGVDHIDYRIRPDVERRFMAAAYERLGSTAIPMHMALFAIPLAVAVRFQVPLVVWGENSAFEYGGSEEERTGFRLDAAWLRRFGVTHGTTWRDWVGEALSERDLVAYRGPSDAEMEAAGVNAVFLGYYFPWDPAHTAAVAARHGFRERASGPRTGYYAFADVDDHLISVHHHLKWHKFGITRLFDNLSLEIRHGRVSRDEAIDVVRQSGDQTPRRDIARFCRFVGMSSARFGEIADGFRNPDVWTRREGRWVIDDFLVPDWRWQ